MEFNLGYEVRETRQLTATIVDQTWSPETITHGLNTGKLRFNDDRTAIVVNEHPVVGDYHKVADIHADEALCGTDYNLPRDFTHET